MQRKPTGQTQLSLGRPKSYLSRVKKCTHKTMQTVYVVEGWQWLSAKCLFMYLLEKYLYCITHVSTSHSDKNYITDYVIKMCPRYIP